MALSMEEQRILAEIERQLAGDDPSLAVRMSKFGRPGLAAGLRTPRGRVLASFLVVAVVALLSLTVYSLMPLRVVPDRGVHGQRTAPLGQSAGQTAQASAQATTKTSAPTTSKPAAKPGKAGRKGGSRAGRPADRRGPRSAAVPSAGPAG